VTGSVADVVSAVVAVDSEVFVSVGVRVFLLSSGVLKLRSVTKRKNVTY
jgi:hypothetical protein